MKLSKQKKKEKNTQKSNTSSRTENSLKIPKPWKIVNADQRYRELKTWNQHWENDFYGLIHKTCYFFTLFLCYNNIVFFLCHLYCSLFFCFGADDIEMITI